MHYEIEGELSRQDPETVERLLHAVDTSALVDRDPHRGVLRVSSIVAPKELSDLLAGAGLCMESSRITRLPSECCGGCGG